MKKQNVVSLLLAALFVITASVIAGSGRETSDIPLLRPSVRNRGFFTLPDVTEKTRTQSLKGENGTVLIFIAVQCPFLMPTTSEWRNSRRTTSSGINVVGINANNTEDASAVKAHASEKHLTFPILKIRQQDRGSVGPRPRPLKLIS